MQPLVSAEANTSLVLLGHGNSLLGWSSAWNVPSLGNGLSVTTLPAPCSNLPFFNVSFNFTSGVTGSEALELDPLYAADLLAVPNATALSFYAFNPSTSLCRMALMRTRISVSSASH